MRASVSDSIASIYFWEKIILPSFMLDGAVYDIGEKN
jgi:hypothetical protein